MSGINLWYDLDWDDSECDKDNDLYEGEDLDLELENEEELELFESKCKNCGAIIEDGYQCEICGWLVGV